MDKVWIVYAEVSPGTIHSSSRLVTIHASEDGAKEAADLLRQDLGLAGHGVWVEDQEVLP